MSKRTLTISIVGSAILIVPLVWYFLQERRIEAYAGVKPFMQTMRRYYDSTAGALRADGELPPEFADMERLTQSAQDVFLVFQKDHRGSDARINGLATGLMRSASQIEHAWEKNDKRLAASRFAELTVACTTCHQQLAEGKPPVLQFDASAIKISE